MENSKTIVLEFETKELKKAIQDLSKNIKKHSVKILRNIQISLKENNMIFRSTDLEVEKAYAFEVILEVEQKPPFDPILVESNEILNLIKNYPSDKISLKILDEELIIEGQNLFVTIPIKKDPNFPDPLDINKLQPKTINFKAIKQAIEKVISSSAKDLSSKMNGVNFKTKGKTLSIAATDGFRLSICKVDLEQEIEMNFTISKKSAQELMKFDAKTALSYQAPNHWIISTSEKTISLKKLDYEYPNYEKAIPLDNKHKFCINREDFLEKLLLTSFQSEVVKISLKDDTLNIQSLDTRINTTTTIRPLTENKDIEFLFKASYLIDGLKIFDEKEVLFTYKDESRPITICLLYTSPSPRD